MEINASGMYEVYAVASDDDGNDITSSVQRIKVNEIEDLGRGHHPYSHIQSYIRRGCTIIDHLQIPQRYL